ncbi:unnamed protein product [Periconia digitata]|uniref:Uncharacterized protein n=1 Tax=Periconia digitata TaxID=1303443 RepID=A0A9W4UHJ4_9PLEO|nr:unnamed protein product [Periconia digitata]
MASPNSMDVDIVEQALQAQQDNAAATAAHTADTEMEDAGLTTGFGRRRAPRETQLPKVFKKCPQNLSADEKAMILSKDKDLYPDHWPLGDSGYSIEVADLFVLRGGADGPPKDMVPGGWRTDKEYATIIRVESGEEGKLVHSWMGFHMDMTADQVRARVQGVELEVESPPEDEVITVQYHLETQIPNLQFSMFDKKSGRKISCRVYGQHLAWKDEGELSPALLDAEDMTRHIKEHGDSAYTAKLAEFNLIEDAKHGLLRLTVELAQENSEVFGENVFLWEGCTDEHVEELARADATTDPVASFYQSMKYARKLQAYMAVPKSQFAKWMQAGYYIQRLITITTYKGSF